MPTKVPTLSTIGWVDTVEKKGDYALSYFFTSEYSQSTLYHGRISSLPYLVKRYGTDEVDLQTHTSDALDSLLRAYFERVDVTVRVNDIDPDQPGKLIIQFRCIIQENGIKYSLGRQVEFIDGKLTEIKRLNNG